MTGRIGLIGGECTGKSELARVLAAELPATVVPEVLRAFVHEHGRTPQSTEQRAILDRQAALEADALVACRTPWLIGDPAPLMTAIYSVVYFDDASLIPDAIEQARGYDLILWCDTDIPWIPDDGQRDGPEFRAAEHVVIERTVRDLMGDLPVLLVSGSVTERVRLAMQAIG
mgnify:CR=1 FL=1